MYKLRLQILLTVLFFSVAVLFVNTAKSQDYFGQITHPSTGDVKFLKVMPTGKMYIGIFGVGVYTSSDNGTTWSPINTGLTNLFVTDLTIKGSDMYVSTFGGGIFKTTNYGTQWNTSNTNLSEFRVNTIFTHPNGWLFAGTYGNGIFYSKDNGAKWVESNRGLFWKDVTSIAMSKNGNLVAGTFGGGIYRSQDTGQTWKNSSSGLKNLFITKIKSNNNNSSLFAGTNGRGVYQSPNDGIAWSELDTNFYYALSPDSLPLPDLNVADITFNSKNELVFSSRYGGIFFWDNDVYYSFRASDMMGKAASSIASGPSNTLYGALPSYTFLSSTDNGAIWKEKNGVVINYKEPKAFAPTNNSLFIYDSTGSIFRSLDSGRTWTQTKPSSKRINQMCIDSIGNLFAGANDGLWKSTNAGLNWNKVFMSNDTTILQVQTAPNGNIWVTTRFYFMKDNGPPNPPTITDIKRVFFSVDNGINFNQATNLSIFPEDPVPNVLGINYNGDVYVSCGTKFWRTKMGDIWSKTADATTNLVTGIDFTQTGLIYVTCTEGIFRSSNYGNTFSKLPVNSLSASNVHVTKTNDDVYVHNSYNFIGSKETWAVMKSTDNGNKWQILVNSYNSELAQGITSSPDGDVYLSLQSGAILKRVNPTTLKAPALIDLPDNQKNVILNPTLKWEKVPKAELYQIEISELNDFAYSWETITQAGLEHKLQRNLLYNTKYFWRTRSKYHSSYSAWSETRTFTTMLEAPYLKSPVDDSIGVTVRANLVWFKTNGATKYDIQVAKDSSFANPVFKALNSADTIITTSQLEGLTIFYWRVKAKSDDSESYWSEIWSFKTVLGPPVLIAPTDSAKDLDVTITFNWHKAKAATMYLIQISEFIEFTVKNEFTVNDTFHINNQFSYFKDYYWRVRSLNAEGASEWSEIRLFTTAMDAPTLISPAQLAVNVLPTTEFDWSSHSIAKNYDLVVAKDKDFKDIVINEEVINADLYNKANLDFYTNYWWKVRGKTEKNIGVWSTENTFKTIVDKINLRVPANLSSNQPIDLDFTWFETNGAIKYHLQVANDAKFEDLIFSQDTLSDISFNLNILSQGKTYHWRVRAKSPEGFGSWSEVWSFSTGTNIVVLKAPANNTVIEKLSITFEWNQVPNASKYHLLASENADFSNPLIDKNDITVLFYSQSIDYNKKIYWKVKGLIDGEESQWSQTWTFSTKDPSSVFDSPIISDLTIKPNPVNEVLTYRFIVLEKSDVKVKVIDITGKNLIEVPLGILNDGTYSYELNVQNLYSGNYFIQLQTSQAVEIKEFKIIK